MQEALSFKIARRTFNWKRVDIEKLILKEVRDHLKKSNASLPYGYTDKEKLAGDELSYDDIIWNDDFEDMNDGVLVSVTMDVEENSDE